MLLVHFASLSGTCLPMIVKHLQQSFFLHFSQSKKNQNYIDLSILMNNSLFAFKVVRSATAVPVLGIIRLNLTFVTGCLV